MFDDVEYHKKNQLGARCEKLLNRIMFQWNLEYTEMQWSYIMCNLTKNVKVNVHFIDPLFKNIAYNTTSQTNTSQVLKNIFLKIRLSSHWDCQWDWSMQENQRKCIYCKINWMEDDFYNILICHPYDIFCKKKKKILLTLFLEDTSKSQSRVSLRLVKISCKF